MLNILARQLTAGNVMILSDHATKSAISTSHLHVSKLKPDGSLLTQEAVQAMQAANHILMSGSKREKAKKLLNHAVKLCPRSPDVWIQLGNYWEFYERNIIEVRSVEIYRRPYYTCES